MLADIKRWLLETATVFRDEMSAVFHDVGIIIFFFALPLAYPIVYSLIYNTEVTRKMPVAVVDNSRTAASREFVRHADATEAMEICGYAKDMQEAKEWMNEKKCFAIIDIPYDYASALGRGSQPQVQFYVDMSLLLRYRTFLTSMTELQMATDADIRNRAMSDLGMPTTGADTSIGTVGYALGDTQQGFASFVIPGIVVLILQQSMLLGIMFLGGTRQEARRRLRGYTPPVLTAATPQAEQADMERGDIVIDAIDRGTSEGYGPKAAPGNPRTNPGRFPFFAPLTCDGASLSAQVIGRMLCYVFLYLPACLYVLNFVLDVFAYPHHAGMLDGVLCMLPMLIATAFLGQALNYFARERESALILIVFTSVAFLFMSGLTWPRYAMPEVLYCIGSLVPATWGLESFVHLTSNGAPFTLISRGWTAMWLLSALYFFCALITVRLQTRPRELKI